MLRNFFGAAPYAAFLRRRTPEKQYRFQSSALTADTKDENLTKTDPVFGFIRPIHGVYILQNKTL